jgi:tricorn protease
LCAYDTETHELSQVLKNDGFDIKSASAGPGGIVYEQFGSLYLYDLARHQSRPVEVRVAGDMPQVRPHFVKVATATQSQIRNQGISPTGARAVFEAHGEILTVPGEKGDIRNITQSPAVADRDPAWSPDGKSIAYFSDESGEYELHIRDQNGTGPVNKIDLGSPPSFFYTPTWSPDSKKIAYSDKRLNLWYVDLGNPKPLKVDTDFFDTPLHEFDVVWSADTKWLAYTKQLPNHLRAAFVYSLETGKATRVTDGMSDVLYPNVDKNGKYLYFTASTDMGLSTGWLDMTSDAHPVTRSVYAVVLRKDLPSPVPPESDDEKGEEAKKPDKDSGATGADQKAAGETAKSGEDKSKATEKKPEPAKVSIDFENILQRIVAMPIPAQNYQGMWAGKEGILYLVQAPQIPPDDGPAPLTLQRFELKTRKTDKLVRASLHLCSLLTVKRCFTSSRRSGTSPPPTSLPRPGREC